MTTSVRFAASAFAALFGAAAAGCGGGLRDTGSAAPRFSVATQNLYYGAEFGAVLAAVDSGDPDAIVLATTQAWADVRASDPAGRAAGVADAIAEDPPDFVGLQEAALFRSQTPSDAFDAEPTSAQTVEVDPLRSVLDALAARGLTYVVAASVESLDVELPALADDGATLMDVRITDRDVLLARVGGPAWSAPRSGLYAAAVPVGGGLSLQSGWVSVDVDVGGRPVRLVSTHLASDVEDVQRAQANELMGDPIAGAGAVVIVGDFNSDALGGTGPDATATHDDVLAAGFADVWADVEPGDPGATWGRAGGLVDPDPTLVERIDYVWARGGVEGVRATRLAEDPADRRAGLWPSDHAGVEALLRVR